MTAYKAAPIHDQLDDRFYAQVDAASFPQHLLRYRNDRAAASVGLDGLSESEWIDHFGRFVPLDGNFPRPLALCYHGHQFGTYNPEIGDGRGFLFAQLQAGDGRILDLGTKGSGQTPFSRTADGRLTLKGAVREILATEMLEALGVNSSKTFSVIETGEELQRHDEPSPTRSAVMVRLSHGHIRIGSFQRLRFMDDQDGIEMLVRHAARHYLAGQLDADADMEQLAVAFLGAVASKVADTAGAWMAAGFVHGVLNTDNFNVTGESFDYGPWRFLQKFTPELTAAYFDKTGRYAYGRQPDAALWALCRLADCFIEQSNKDRLEQALSPFFDIMEKAMIAGFLHRLGMKLPDRTDDGNKAGAIVNTLLHGARISQIGFDQMFFDLYGRSQAPNQSYQTTEFEAYFAALEDADVQLASRSHPYFQKSGPVSLVIDEVERIWAPIASSDDFSALDEMLAHIRLYGEALSRP